MEEFDGRIVMLILFVVISGAKWFFEQIKNKNQSPHETSESLEEIYDDFRDEIRRRQTQIQHPEDHFVQEEQLQQPHIQPTQQAQSPPPMPVTIPQQQEYVPDPIPQPREIRKPQLSEQEKAALAAMQQRSLPMPSRKHTRNAHASLRKLLASPESARQAIVLHEVLGKPRSMEGSEA